MATKKYLSLDRLTEYDELLKSKISADDAATLKSAKEYADGLVTGGHNHDDSYYTESEIDAKLSEVNTSITNITNGEIVVKEAEHAGSADEATHATSSDSATTAETATKATQDASGNVITETYETKEDATAKYDELKAYTDGQIETHVHSWNDLEDKPFYVEYSGENVLLKEANVTVYKTGQWGWIDGYEFQLVEGKTYKVVFNGVVYECVAYTSPNGEVVIGNLSRTGIGTGGNNEPFCLRDYNLHAQAGTYTVSVSEVQKNIVTLSEDFIPDTIARTEYVDANFALKSDLNNIDLSGYETKEDSIAKYDEVKSLIVQSDWNQNDANALDYVKNRTHYEGIELVEFLPEITITTESSLTQYDPSEEKGYAAYISSSSFTQSNFDVEEIVVTIDGVDYIYTGSYYTYRSTSDDAPILYISNDYRVARYIAYAKEANKEYTISISQKSSSIKQLDEKFIPDTIARVADIDSALESINDGIKANADAIAAEKERSEGIEESLQNQINTIMNNPDAEGAINSINEFTQYVKDHGTIADGFRSDIDDLKSAVDGKAAEGHKHEISDVNELQTKLDEKAAQSSLDAHTGNTTAHITATERTNWGTAYTHSQAAHAPSNAQENVIESIKVNGTAQTITSKSVDITVPTKTSELTHDSGFLVASDIANKADKATTLAGYGITDAYTKSEVDAKTEVDSALSSTSTKPVQNKVVNSAIVTATNAISANTNSINLHTDRIGALEEKVGEGFEPISSEEIQNLFKS